MMEKGEEQGGEGGEGEGLSEDRVRRRDAAYRRHRKHLIDEITRGVIEMVKKMQKLNENMERMQVDAAEIQRFNEAWLRFYGRVASPVLPPLLPNPSEADYEIEGERENECEEGASEAEEEGRS